MLSEEVKKLIVSPTQMALDHQMVPYDIWGTKVHVLGLCKTEVIGHDTAKEILNALEDIEKSYHTGEFQIDPERGAQLTLEKEIVARAGEQAGLSTHTARSRNDQVMLTELLYLREQTLDIYQNITEVLPLLLSSAEKYRSTPMPGYTHMQPGKPTTLAHWFLAYHDSLARSLTQIEQLVSIFDMSPLGAVESFGSSWPLDRQYTAKLLGFADVWQVPQDAISNRGIYQLQLLTTLANALIPVGKMASDLMLYCTHEYRYLSFGSSVAQRLHPITGSSVMAQKKNPDALELLRSIPPQVAGFYQSTYGVLHGLPSGYNRDSRETKEYITSGISKSNTAFAVLKQVIPSLLFDVKRMEQTIRDNYSLTTDLADYISQGSGIPYRKVYKIVGQAVDELMESSQSLEQISASRLSDIAQEMGEQLELNDANLAEILEPAIALEKRQNVGGTNSEITGQLIDQRNASLNKYTDWLKTRLEKIEQARAATATAVADFII